jgi:cob(I)alamin adenosyltransferase
MVKLDRIYTGGGDKGETSLSDGTRVAKHSARMQAQGDTDEANAAIGLALLHLDPGNISDALRRIQNDLFDLGADISRPGDESDDGNLRIQASQVNRLEAEIDAANEALQPLKSFVLRGGSPAAAHLHFACTVTRRAERSFTALAAIEPVNSQAGIYLNRLSDLLFVLARRTNDDGTSDILWQPGLTAGE